MSDDELKNIGFPNRYYIFRSIADLKRELVRNEEQPTTLAELYKDGEPLSDEFKRMFGLE